MILEMTGLLSRGQNSLRQGRRTNAIEGKSRDDGADA